MSTDLTSLSERVADLERRLAVAEGRTLSNRASLLVISGELDKLFAALSIATGAVAMGFDVSMYFTFWGLTALKRAGAPRGEKSLMEWMLGTALPASADALPLSRLHFMGAGTLMMRRVMVEKRIETVPNLLACAQELGVKLVACEISMHAMGLGRSELIDGVEFGGVAAYLEDAMDSKLTLFI